MRLSSMSGEELSYLSTVIAVAVAKDLTADELELLALLLSAISSVLGIIALQRPDADSSSSTTPPTSGSTPAGIV